MFFANVKISSCTIFFNQTSKFCPSDCVHFCIGSLINIVEEKGLIEPFGFREVITMNFEARNGVLETLRQGIRIDSKHPNLTFPLEYMMKYWLAFVQRRHSSKTDILKYKCIQWLAACRYDIHTDANVKWIRSLRIYIFRVLCYFLFDTFDIFTLFWYHLLNSNSKKLQCKKQKQLKNWIEHFRTKLCKFEIFLPDVCVQNCNLKQRESKKRIKHEFVTWKKLK